MRIAAAAVIAGVAFVGARGARHLAAEQLAGESAPNTPYTPAAATAPFFSLGYREALADILYVRLRGYFGSYYGTTGEGIVSLADAIVALDPKFYRAYDYAANAATMAEAGVDQAALLRAISLLERGMQEFPKDWQLPLLAGQIYLQDLKTSDPQQRRAWDERGVLLVESAIRKPGAPQKAAMYAAQIRTKLGEHERAVEGLKELLLTSHDAALRTALLKRLADLEAADATEVGLEILTARKTFERKWRAERPAVPATMYILVGPEIPRRFDLADLATGGRDLVGSEEFERLEPVE